MRKFNKNQATTGSSKDIFIYFLIFATTLFSVNPSLSAEPLSKISEEIELITIEANTTNMFEAERYDEIDIMHGKYLKTKEKTSNGSWKLAYLGSSLFKLADKEIPIEGYWDDHEERAKTWIALNPSSSIAHLVYAKLLIDRAWMYRGDGWDQGVELEDWDKFYRYIAKARKHLTVNEKEAKNDPQFYQLMLTIAKLEGWSLSEFNALLDEAVARYPSFYPIYFAASDYFSPKWHGSHIAFENFARRITTLTESLEKKSIYARIYWHAYRTIYGADLFVGSAIDWKYMRQSMDDVLAQYPSQWNINHFAYFSCLAGDAPTTKKLIADIAPQPIRYAWKYNENFLKCKNWSETQLRL